MPFDSVDHGALARSRCLYRNHGKKYQYPRSRSATHPILCTIDREKKTSNDQMESDKVDVLSKAAWVSAEILGNVARAFNGNTNVADPSPPADESKPITKEDALDRLRKEYDRSYFLSGEMDVDLYTEDCLFAGSTCGGALAAPGTPAAIDQPGRDLPRLQKNCAVPSAQPNL